MKFTESIQQYLLNSLPGKKIQYQMAPENRSQNVLKRDGLQKKGAVLILLFERKNELFFLLMKRADDLKFHSRQISFPGGSFELSDKSLQQTALRETFEETGFKVSDSQVLGKLTPLYIPVSNFQVLPFVAFSQETPKWKKNDSEVKSLIEVNLKDFLKLKPLFKEIIEEGKIIKIPYFPIGKYEVWGATAMILNEFKFILLK